MSRIPPSAELFSSTASSTSQGLSLSILTADTNDEFNTDDAAGDDDNRNSNSNIRG